jgi:hypothetical protein
VTLSDAEVKALFDEAERERAFWDSHYQEFIETYPDQFVAVHNGKVVAANLDLFGLVADLDMLGLKPRQVWSEFIEATPRTLIL